MRVAFFSIQPFEAESLRTANQGRHELVFYDAALQPATARLCQHAEAVCIFVNDDGAAPVLEALSELGVKYIALRCAGYNNVDLARARQLGLRVANVPEYSPYAVAEHSVALMLALNRKIVRANNRVRDLNFSLNGLVGFDMHGKTVGVVGLGKIGLLTARILIGFGCRLLAFDIQPDPQLSADYGITFVDLDRLCREADIITLHAPLNPHTFHLIDAARIASMKRGVMLINTSRGALVDTQAVVEALKTGQIGYLGLDVYEEEQGLFFYDRSSEILQDDVIARLLTFPNVLITSHQGFLTDTALTNIAEVTFENLERWADGHESPHELALREGHRQTT